MDSSLFLGLLEGDSKTESLADLMCGERLLSWFIHGHLLAVSLHGGKKAGKLSGGSCYKGTNPVHEGSVLMTEAPPRGPTSNSVMLRVR